VPGVEEHKIARGAVLQQISQIWGAGCMLVALTIVGRHFGPTRFGGYTVITALTAVVATVQVAVDGIAVRHLSAESSPPARGTAFSTVCVLYGVLGLLSGALILGVGLVVIELIGSRAGLTSELRDAVLAVAAVTALGWPARSSRELLRADHRFGLVAGAEFAAFTTVAAGVAVLVAIDAPLWAVTTVAGSMNLFAGLYCWLTRSAGERIERFRLGDVSHVVLRELLGGAAGLAALGAADLLTYALDPAILGAFRGPRAVGLYGAAARPPNLLYQLTGSVGLIVMPVAARYHASGDEQRLHDLIVRGTRYALAATAPLAVTLIVMAGPLLHFWLGRTYEPAAPALAIGASYWVVTAGNGITIWNLMAAGKMNVFFRYAWSVTAANFVLSVVLSWQLGLVGVVLGTAVPALVGFFFLTSIEVRELPVTVRELARQSWLPAWLVASIVGIICLALRLLAPPDSLFGVAGEAAVALAVGWAVLWRWLFSSQERALVLALARNPFV